MSTSQEKRKSRRKFKRHILLESSPTPQPQPQHLQDPVQEQKTNVPVQSVKQVKFSLTQSVSDLLFRPSIDWMKPTHLGRAASFTPHSVLFVRNKRECKDVMDTLKEYILLHSCSITDLCRNGDDDNKSEHWIRTNYMHILYVVTVYHFICII